MQVKGHNATLPLPSPPQVQALLKKEEYPSLANVSLMASGDPAYLSVMEAGGYSGTVAGPVVISAGQVCCHGGVHGRTFSVYE